MLLEIAEITESKLLLLRWKLFPPKAIVSRNDCWWTVKTFTVYATVICPLAFPDFVTVEIVTLSGILLDADTVADADTVHFSGWCWFWIVTGMLTYPECWGQDTSNWRIDLVCIISRGIPIIWIKGWRIIIMAVLMVLVNIYMLTKRKRKEKTLSHWQIGSKPFCSRKCI